MYLKKLMIKSMLRFIIDKSIEKKLINKILLPKNSKLICSTVLLFGNAWFVATSNSLQTIVVYKNQQVGFNASPLLHTCWFPLCGRPIVTRTAKLGIERELT